MSQPTPQGEQPRDATLRRIEAIIARLLRSGVLLSLALMVIGTLVSFFHSHRYGSTADDQEESRMPRKGSA